MEFIDILAPALTVGSCLLGSFVMGICMGRAEAGVLRSEKRVLERKAEWLAEKVEDRDAIIRMKDERIAGLEAELDSFESEEECEARLEAARSANVVAGRRSALADVRGFLLDLESGLARGE